MNNKIHDYLEKLKQKFFKSSGKKIEPSNKNTTSEQTESFSVDPSKLNKINEKTSLLRRIKNKLTRKKKANEKIYSADKTAPIDVNDIVVEQKDELSLPNSDEIQEKEQKRLKRKKKVLMLVMVLLAFYVLIEDENEFFVEVKEKIPSVKKGMLEKIGPKKGNEVLHKAKSNKNNDNPSVEKSKIQNEAIKNGNDINDQKEETGKKDVDQGLDVKNDLEDNLIEETNLDHQEESLEKNVVEEKDKETPELLDEEIDPNQNIQENGNEIENIDSTHSNSSPTSLTNNETQIKNDSKLTNDQDTGISPESKRNPSFFKDDLTGEIKEEVQPVTNSNGPTVEIEKEKVREEVQELGNLVNELEENGTLKTKYEPPPDYSRLGRGLVYNCKEKHWACVDRESYFQCRNNGLWNFNNKRDVECSIQEVYATIDNCTKAQKLKVQGVTDTSFCHQK